MRQLSQEQVRQLIAEQFAAALKEHGVQDGNMPDELDLMLAGVTDSLGMMGLIAAVNEAAEQEVDFEGLDAERFTVVGDFCRFVARQTGGS
jgi:acyl carrier protein